MPRNRKPPPQALLDAPPHIRILTACEVLAKTLKSISMDLDLCPACLCEAFHEYTLDVEHEPERMQFAVTDETPESGSIH